MSGGGTSLHAGLGSATNLDNRIEKGANFTVLLQMLPDAGADVEASHERWEQAALELATGLLRNALPEAIVDAVLQAAAEQNGPVPLRGGR